MNKMTRLSRRWLTTKDKVYPLVDSALSIPPRKGATFLLAVPSTGIEPVTFNFGG